LTLYYKYVKIKKMKMEREGRKPQREGRVLQYLRGGRLVAMGRIGKDKSKMKFSDRYPKLQLRVGDDLLAKIEKEIKRTGMNTSEIAKKALDDYFAKR